MSLVNAERRATDKQDSADTGLFLQVSLLGEFSLRQRGKSVPLDTPRHQSLLAYLIIHAQRVHTRQQLAFQFWPDSSESQARTNLRKALYTLRRALPDADCFLAVDRRTVQWRQDAPCVVDVWDFEAAVTQSQQTNSPSEQQKYLRQAINAYYGDFLPGSYDDWVMATREKLRQYYLTALEKLLFLHESRRQYPAAIGVARKLLREDPLHEAAYRRLMRLQSLDGNVAGALRTYHACSTLLQRELGVDSSPATQEAYERLLRVKAPPAPMAPARLPLVARKQDWQALQTAWKQCSRGQPGVVLLTGEAGIGKTRLAEEMLDWAERQGIVVVTAVCYPSEKQLAYAPVAKWLRNEHLKPIFNRLEKRRLVECSRLLPELQKKHPDLPDPGPLSESWQRQHFFSALAQTLLQLRQPFLLFVDDLPWCDRDTLDWLPYLLQYETQSRFLLLGAARSEEITPDHLLIPWQQQLDRDGRLTKIALGRLDADASARLAGHVLQKDLDGQQTARLYAETEGNPLFVVEMARAGLDTLLLADQSVTLSPKVQAIIETRLGSLSPSAYQSAQLAAVIGRSFAFTILNQACTQSEDSVIRSLDELWQRRLIRERGVDAYDFSHDKFRQVAYESLSQARRRQLHKQVWQSLETLHAGNLDAVSGQIGAHCEAAGCYQEAIAHYRRAAKVAQAVYANQDTLDYLQRAIDLFSQAEVKPQQQLEIHEQQGDVLTMIGRYEEAEAVLTKSVQLTKEPVVQSRIHRKIANTRQLRRQHDKAFEVWQICEDSLGTLSADWSQAFWQEWLWIQLDKSWVLYWTNRLAELESLLKEIHPIVEERGTTSQQGLHYQRLVWLSLRRDRFVLPDETIEYAKLSFETIQESGTSNQIAFSQFVLGLTLYHHGWLGDFVEAEYHMKSALTLAQELGDIVLQTRCLIHLSQNYLRQGDLASAKTFIPQAMALARKSNILEYVLMAEGLESWYAWRNNDFVESQQLGEHALELAKDLPFGWPGKWVVAIPLVSIALMHNEIEKGIEYARLPLGPGQMRLRDELMAVLQKAVDAWENNRPDAARAELEQALQLAQANHYL
jgi:DNA-binding SARP family transcriptional activator